MQIQELLKRITITEDFVNQVDAMLDKYYELQKKFVIDKQTTMHELLVHSVKDADTLAVWYLIQEETIEKFITKMKDMFLNCQDNINKFVLENGTIHITYKELLDAIITNLVGITEKDIRTYIE